MPVANGPQMEVACPCPYTCPVPTPERKGNNEKWLTTLLFNGFILIYITLI
jgi:hypothetical protein